MKSFRPNQNFEFYMYWISERMSMFWNKAGGLPQPYTDDKILQEHKFTNVYRVLDRSSQYLLSNVIYNGKNYSKEDMFWRIVLYKNYNLPATWDHLIKELGDITLATPDKDIIEILDRLTNSGATVYSNAYMLTCPFMRKESFLKEYNLTHGNRKYTLYLKIFRKDLIERGLMEEAFAAKDFEGLFRVLNKVLSFGEFLAYQIAQDLCYTEIFNFNENEFCAAGPGTQRGIQRTFEIEGTPDYNEIVKWVHKNFDDLVKNYGYSFVPLPNRNITVPDLSNCFCETDKYLRGLGITTDGVEVSGSRIKQKYKESGKPISYFFPPKWDVWNI